MFNIYVTLYRVITLRGNQLLSLPVYLFEYFFLLSHQRDCTDLVY